MKAGENMSRTVRKRHNKDGSTTTTTTYRTKFAGTTYIDSYTKRDKPSKKVPKKATPKGKGTFLRNIILAIVFFFISYLFMVYLPLNAGITSIDMIKEKTQACITRYIIVSIFPTLIIIFNIYRFKHPDDSFWDMLLNFFKNIGQLIKSNSTKQRQNKQTDTTVEPIDTTMSIEDLCSTDENFSSQKSESTEDQLILDDKDLVDAILLCADVKDEGISIAYIQDKLHLKSAQAVCVMNDLENLGIIGSLNSENNTHEILMIPKYIKYSPNKSPAQTEDSILDEAAKICVDAGAAGVSVSYLQKKLNLGYSKAAHIMDELQDMGIVGSPVSGKNREVLMTPEQYEKYMQYKQNNIYNNQNINNQ